MITDNYKRIAFNAVILLVIEFLTAEKTITEGK
jgi:hypothetical protein